MPPDYAEHDDLSRPTAGQAALTTSQRRIVGMALDGADDRDIAQRLFITPRSVQTTLAAIREQVGVASPEELRAALAPR